MVIIQKIQTKTFRSPSQVGVEYSSIYNANANGQAEAFNKTLVRLLKKIVSKNKRDWHEKMINTLRAYCTSYRSLTQSTLYALVFGLEAVIPLEVEIPSLRIAVQNKMATDYENTQLRLDELDTVDEVKIGAQQNQELYQSQVESAYNKMARPRTFQKGELVLVPRRPIIKSKHM